MASTNDVDDLTKFRHLLENIRSKDENERKQTISQIPILVLKSFEGKGGIINQLLLVIYNLNTEAENFETLNLGNRTQVVGHLLRLYSETITDHEHEQIDSLVKIIQHIHSSELLIELAYALNQCHEAKITKEDKELVEEGLVEIKERATAKLFPDALLMIHSIIAMK